MVSAIEKQVLQSQVLERIQQVQQQHPDLQQQYFKVQFGEERRRLKKKVNQSDHIDHTTVDGEGGQKEPRHHPDEPEPEERLLDESTAAGPKQPDHIDIKV
ncbi:MAG: hypothetical protein LLG97_11930 [Deltaproteobacteria bacterium]|nr:hypothetical protein [Deltaproteobacteria bacterium]